MRLLEDVDLWVAAYAKSAPNPGSLTRGGAEGTIDGTSLRTLKALQLSVLDGRFQWGITHLYVLYVPKPKGGPKAHKAHQDHAPPLAKRSARPIPEFQDRIVQETTAHRRSLGPGAAQAHYT